MKFKRLLSVGLALCLTLAFSSTAFAADHQNKTTNKTSVTTTDSMITPDFASTHPVLYPTHDVTAWVTAQPSLFVRSGAGDTYTAVDTVYYGDQLYVFSTTSNNWAYIGNGYVSGYYLTTVLSDIV